MHRLLQRDQERIAELADILAGDYGSNAGQRQGSRCFDAPDLRVRMRRAGHMGVQGAVRDWQIVRKTPASRQEGGVFFANERSTQGLRHEITVPIFGHSRAPAKAASPESISPTLVTHSGLTGFARAPE